MRHLFFTAAFLISISGFSQSEEELGDIAKVVCNCISKKDLNFKDSKAVEMGLGICFLEVIQEKKLNIAISDGAAMETFGRSVGIRMAGVCPKVFEAFMGTAQDDSSKPEDNVEISGTVKGVDAKEMTTLVIRDNAGKEHKLLWLHYFNGSDDFVGDPKKIIGKNVTAAYKIVDIYLFSQKSYVTVKELTNLSIK